MSPRPRRCPALSQPSPAARHDHFGLPAPFLPSRPDCPEPPARLGRARTLVSIFLSWLSDTAMAAGAGAAVGAGVGAAAAAPGAAGPALHKHRKRPRARFRRRRRSRASRGGHRAGTAGRGFGDQSPPGAPHRPVRFLFKEHDTNATSN